MLSPEFVNTALFGVYPYVCLTVLFVGSLIRFDREPYSWRSGSSQLLRRKQLMWGSNLFHIGILVIFLGHFVGLLTPIGVFDALGISHGAKQLLAIVVGGVAGVMCLAGLVMLLHRRLTDPRIRKTSSWSDILVLWLLLAQLALGLLEFILHCFRHGQRDEETKLRGRGQRLFPFLARERLTVDPCRTRSLARFVSRRDGRWIE